MTSPPRLRAAHLRVPASTSNLGAGFDCVGLALGRYLAASYEPAAPDGAPLRLERRGTLHALAGHPVEEDLFVRAFRAGLAARGATLGGGTLTLDSEIPVARGLGSSAAAVVGGLALAAAATGGSPEAAAVFRAAREWEGHLDNVAPALLGGLVAVALDDAGTPRAFPLPLAPTIGFSYAAPGVGLETARARAVLPRTVPLADAVHNVGAMAALAAGLATGDPELIALGLSDRLHVRHRLPLIPGAPDAIAAARHAGAWGATISGAGSGVIALGPLDRATEVADVMARAFRDAAGLEGSVGFAVEPDRAGATMEVLA
jgi:homoserine kinase